MRVRNRLFMRAQVQTLTLPKMAAMKAMKKSSGMKVMKAAVGWCSERLVCDRGVKI